jgi:hypothetical protein
MREMYNVFSSTFCRRELTRLDHLYPPTKHIDPFRNTPLDELVGVTILYPEALGYLLDVKETLPLIGYAGLELGLGL